MEKLPFLTRTNRTPSKSEGSDVQTSRSASRLVFALGKSSTRTQEKLLAHLRHHVSWKRIRGRNNDSTRTPLQLSSQMRNECLGALAYSPAASETCFESIDRNEWRVKAPYPLLPSNFCQYVGELYAQSKKKPTRTGVDKILQK